MKTMNDNDIDKLIAESLKREAILDDINRQVMKSVKAKTRKRGRQKWGKLLLTCFGLPLIVLAPTAWMVLCANQESNPWFTGALLLGLAGFVLPAIWLTNNLMKDFSQKQA